jgi:hypothetical protein
MEAMENEPRYDFPRTAQESPRRSQNNSPIRGDNRLGLANLDHSKFSAPASSQHSPQFGMSHL